MTAIIKTDYAALAAEVSIALSTIVESLADLEARTVSVTDAAWEDYMGESRTAGTSQACRGAHHDWQFAKDLKRSVENVRSYAAQYHEDAVKAERNHAEAYAEIEQRRQTDLIIEAAKTTAPIDSGFTLLSANIELSKGKPTDIATVLYVVEGTIYEANVKRDPHTEALSITKGFCDYESAQVRIEGDERRRKWFFWAGQTPEEIGKGVDIKQKVIRAAKLQFDRLPKKRSR